MLFSPSASFLKKSLSTVILISPLLFRSNHSPRLLQELVSNRNFFTHFTRQFHQNTITPFKLKMVADKYTILADNDNIERPILDDRSYRFIKLNNNDLHVLLINDPSTDKSAAALDVNVGSFADKKYNVSGLAHFCEHLLFMGTKKYPEENEYSSYLSKHSGYSNAYTAAEHTNYYFEVSSNYLDGALDRFAQFFISPLFSKSCKDREIKAVDSENKKNLQNDMWRFYQLDKLTSNPNHPFNGFSTGNYQTLHEQPTSDNVNVRDVLLDFYHKEYSSNIMSLVILGKENLDQLTYWAIEKFESIPNVNLPRPNYNGEVIYNPEHLGKLIKAKPIKDSHKLEVSFLIPDDQEDNWKSRPASYFSHLLGHESKGSLYYYLNEKHWVNDLSAGNMKVCQGNSIFVLELELTEKGLENWQSVIVHLFEYLKLISNKDPQQWIWEEISNMSKVNFKFTQKKGASSTVSRQSSILYKFTEDSYVPPNYLLNSTITREFDPVAIKEYGSYFNPDNIRILLSSQKLENLPLTEKWYGTEHLTEPIPQTFLSQLKNVSTNTAFHLPVKNEFIPDDFTIVGKKSENPLLHPYIIHNDEKSQVWFKKDDRFEVPKGLVSTSLHLPSTTESVKSFLYCSLIVKLVNDELNDMAYLASLVGLAFNFHRQIDGFGLDFDGYSDKMPVLLEHVIHKVTNFTPNKEKYLTLKEKTIQQLKNSGYDVPYSQAGRYIQSLFNDKIYTREEKLAALNSNELSFEELVTFNREMWSNGVFASTLIHGNFDYERSMKINSLLQKHLSHLKPIAENKEEVSKALQYRSYFVSPNERATFESPLQDANNVNSCIEYYIQIEDKLKHDRLLVLADLMSTTINEACFNQLRTKEQLGYVVFSGVRLTKSRFGFRVLIQSERPCDYLEYRIEEFLHKFRTNFIAKELTDENFNKFKEALTDKKLSKLKNLSEEFNRLSGQISTGYFDFNQRQRHVDILTTITKDEFINFYDDYINVSNSQSKSGRLVLYLKSQCTPRLATSKELLSSVNNFLYNKDLVLESDIVDSILEKQGESVEKIIDEVTSELLKNPESTKHISPDIDSFKNNFASYVRQALVNPVPSIYPRGKVFTDIGSFRRSNQIADIPKPVEPLSKFYYKLEEHAHL